MNDAAQETRHLLSQLESLFNHLYSDAWSLVRETYTDMRERIWLSTPERAALRKTAGPDASPLKQGSIGTSTTSNSYDSGLEGFLLDAFARLNSTGKVVKAEDLTIQAERAGFAPLEAIDALYNLTFVQRRLYVAGEAFTPTAVLAASEEEAARMQAVSDESIATTAAANAIQSGSSDDAKS